MILAVLKTAEKYLHDVELHVNRDVYEEDIWFAKTDDRIGEKLDSSHPIFRTKESLFPAKLRQD